MMPEHAGVNPTSDQQYKASAGGTTPGFELIRDGIGAVGVPVGFGNVPYTLCYLIEDGGGSLHVVDPGDDLNEGWQSLMSALRSMGKSVSDVASVTATHFHPDHLALAWRLRSASGAVVGMHRLDRDDLRRARSGVSRPEITERLRDWGVPPEAQDALRRLTGVPGDPDVEPDRLLADGDRIDAPGRNLLIRHTPGHTAGHICVQLDDERLLLSGDHVVPTVAPGIGLSAGADSGAVIIGYLDSLDAVAALDGYEVLPGHGYRFRGLAAQAGFIRDRHLARTREVIDALGRAPGASVWEIASQLTWRAGWEGLRPLFRFTALAQTQMHMRFAHSGRAEAYLARVG
jgi:glyoxylase-like metal-dependent hydrolase (beta-lactamase superfamily II)